ncbi:TPA: class I SAM-dependent rRNA methyltransferase, partial [Desulfurococcaceae archaeon]|nr:class I SAM-dependent rRNA methyltransferase [Desulfurococcaceae archaeon]
NFDEGKVRVVREDIWSYLRARLKRRETTEVASYDPPAFIPTKEKLEEGMRDYMRLYVYALKLADPSSVVMLSSCSQPFTRDMFLWTIAKASYFSNRESRVFAVRGASRDHVFPPGSTYMEYLKFAALSVF